MHALSVDLAERVGDGAGRPLLEGDKDEIMRRLLDERAPRYEEVADAVVDVKGLTPTGIFGINNVNQVTGYSYDANGPHAFVAKVIGLP